MNLCNEHWEEICHEGRPCPACELVEQLKVADEEISRLKYELKQAQEELSDAQG